MHQLLRKILQRSPIFFGLIKIAVLNIGGTPSYLFLKSTNEKTIFSILRLFYLKSETSTAKTYAANNLMEC